MRFAVFVVFCLTLNSIVGQAVVDSKLEYDCEDLTARIQSFKESTRSRKEKFSCILNLLKSALADELEYYIDSNDKNDVNKTNFTRTHFEENNEIKDNENNESVEKDLYDKLVLKTEKKECNNNNNTNWDIPTMIPIFKPKPVVNDKAALENSQLIPKQDTVQATQTTIPKYPAFTIPCQRAADILDMSVIPRERNKLPMKEVNLQVKEIMNDVLVLPREIICDERRETNVPRNVNNQPKDRDIVNDIPPRETNIQPRNINTQPRDVARGIMKEVEPQSNLNLGTKLPTTNFEKPKTLAMHCKDADESVAVFFKPKAITLEQLYGNLLKKLTITVLVPYHMSKLGKVCEF